MIFNNFMLYWEVSSLLLICLRTIARLMSWWEPDCSFCLCFCRGPLQKHPSGTAAWLQIEFPIWWESLILWCFLGFCKIEIPLLARVARVPNANTLEISVRTGKGCEPWIHRSCQHLIMWLTYVYPKKKVAFACLVVLRKLVLYFIWIQYPYNWVSGFVWSVEILFQSMGPIPNYCMRLAVIGEMKVLFGKEP